MTEFISVSKLVIMINSLKLKGFQSHINSKLDFSPGLNVIIGETDSGKSAIIRALKWVLFNKPEGDSFINYDADKALVKIELDENKITKTRKDKTTYKLNDSEFNALHGKLPEEIESLINMSEINLQEQADGPFLLSQTPGAIGMFFNKIAGLDKIDKSISFINSEIRSLNSKEKHIKEEIEKKQKELEQFKDLSEIENQLILIEQKQAVYDTIIQKIGIITEIIKKCQRIKEKGQEFENLIKFEPLVNEILEKQKKLTDLRNQYVEAKKFFKTVNSIDIQIKTYQNISKSEKLVNKCLEKFDSFHELQSTIDSLTNLKNSLDGCVITIDYKEKDYHNLVKDYEETFPDICPLCNQQVKK